MHMCTWMTIKDAKIKRSIMWKSWMRKNLYRLLVFSFDSLFPDSRRTQPAGNIVAGDNNFAHTKLRYLIWSIVRRYENEFDSNLVETKIDDAKQSPRPMYNMYIAMIISCCSVYCERKYKTSVSTWANKSARVISHSRRMRARFILV